MSVFRFVTCMKTRASLPDGRIRRRLWSLCRPSPALLITLCSPPDLSLGCLAVKAWAEQCLQSSLSKDQLSCEPCKFMRIFLGFRGEEPQAIGRWPEPAVDSNFGRHIFGTIAPEASIIMQRHSW